MISTIHDASSCATGKTNWQTGEEIKKLVSIGQYNNYMKGVDLADQYLSTCSILRKKTNKMDKENSAFFD